MMDEEKQLDNLQSSTSAEVSQVSEETEVVGKQSTHVETNEPDAAGTEVSSDPVVGSPQVDEPGTTAEAQSVDGDADSDRATMAALTQAAETAKALEDLKTQYTRLAADFENYRKRTQKEKEELEEQAKCSTIKELLPIVDNFERARSQIKPQTDSEMTIHKSYQSVYKQMVDCLKRIGVAPMRPEGQEFDPNLHEAVMREATDKYTEGAVIEELMRGYTLGERVLRHAMVKVATAPEPEMTSSTSNETDNSDA